MTMRRDLTRFLIARGAGAADAEDLAQDLFIKIEGLTSGPIARDRLRRIDAALDALPERTAAAFRRFRIDGASQRDIASEFGISISAVEKHLQRALDAQRQIDAEPPGPRRPSGENADYVTQT